MDFEDRESFPETEGEMRLFSRNDLELPISPSPDFSRLVIGTNALDERELRPF